MLYEFLSARALEFDGNGAPPATGLDGLGSNSTNPYNASAFLSLDSLVHLRASQYAVGAAITLWVYDLFLIFESELELFWKKRDRLTVNVLYLLVSLLVFL